jgi:hypothetical protein
MTACPFRTLTAIFLACLCQAAIAADVPVPVRPRDPVMSPFGIGSSAMRSRDHSVWVPQMAEIGLLDLRACMGSWGVQPEEGVWSWTTLDDRLTYLESLGVSSGVLFNSLPKWNTKDQRGACR